MGFKESHYLEAKNCIICKMVRWKSSKQWLIVGKNHPLRKRKGLYKEVHLTKKSKMRWSDCLPFKSSDFLLLDFNSLMYFILLGSHEYFL